MTERMLRVCALLLLGAGFVTGCGGSGSSATSSTPVGGDSPAPVTGVSTPSSVAVVTAKNAS